MSISHSTALKSCGVMVAFCAALALAAASAQTQTLNFSLGYFAVTGEDGRVDDDVLVANLSTGTELLLRDWRFQQRLRGWRMAGRDRATLRGRRRNGYYRSTVPSIYRDLTRRTTPRFFRN